MTTQISIMASAEDDPEAESCVCMPCGDTQADEAVLAAGHEPTVDFLQSLIEYLQARDDLALRIDFDCEAGTFVATGDMSSLERVRTLLQVYTCDGDGVAALITEAEEAGFTFDD